MQEIKRNEAEIAHLLHCVDNAKRFNVGDYLIRYVGENKSAELNSYFIERRFQVVHVDINGVCYIKEVMGTKTSSWIMTMANLGNSIETARSRSHYGEMAEFRYELDPLYEDHIIMQQDGKYDPSIMQSDKSKLHKEITAHNKALKIKTVREADAVKFIKTIKVGDTLWFSNVTSFIVQEIKDLPKRGSSSQIDYYAPILLGITNKGKNLKLSVTDVTRKAVYTACPRSYKELKT